MTKIRQKNPRLKLDLEGYRDLHLRVLRRDGWRCQACGRMKTLEVHHIQFRSHAGSDVEDNLITLCTECHARMHCHGYDPTNME